MDGVVPVRVKPMGREPEGGELLIGDGAALRIRPPIQLAPHPQACGRPGRADQVDDHRETHQRLPPPVAADVRKEPMLDRVPLARSRREVAGRDGQARAIGQLLQLPLPEPEPSPVAASGIGRDEQRARR